MATLVYRCPTTGMKTQGWLADAVSENGDDAYEAVSCLACTGVHLINPKTGKVLGVAEEC